MTDQKYLGRTADTGDHVKAVPGFKERACLASFRGAIGDCVRPKGHAGPHQGAEMYAWENVAATFKINDAVTPTCGALRGEIGYVVKLGKRPWADVRFPNIGRVPSRFPQSSLQLVDEAVAR